MFKGRLAGGAALRWDGAHGDEVVYVATGELAVDGRVCPAGGAAIIEADVAAEAVAHGDCELLHYGPHDPRPPVDGPNGTPAPGCTVHVVGPGGTWAQVDGTRETWYFADSTCPTCRATL